MLGGAVSGLNFPFNFKHWSSNSHNVELVSRSTSLTVGENMLGGAVSRLNFPVNFKHRSSNSHNVELVSQSTTLNSETESNKTNRDSKSGQQSANEDIIGSCDQTFCSSGETELGPTKMNRIYKCPLCDYANSRMYNLNRHMRCHTGQKFRCNMCSAEYNCKYKLQQHRMLKHGFKQNFLLGYDYRQAHRNLAPAQIDTSPDRPDVDCLLRDKTSLLKVKDEWLAHQTSMEDEHQQKAVDPTSSFS